MSGINIPENLTKDCITLYKGGAGRMEVARLIMDETGLKKSAAKVRAKNIWDEEFGEKTGENSVSIPKPSGKNNEVLAFSDKYIYNREVEKYIFLTESKLGKNLVLPESTVKNIIKSYSNFNGESSSINEISNKYDIPRNFVIEILKILGVTHDSLPVTNEELSDKEEDSLLEEILQQKRFSLNQRIEREDWRITQADAKKWRELQVGTLNPLRDYLDELVIQPLPKIRPEPAESFDDEDTIVVGIFDLQIGSYASEDVLYFGEGWSTDKAVKTVDAFARKIVAKAKKQGIDKAVLIFGGDIFHGLNGQTAKGTPLKCDTVQYDQFDAAIKAINGFIQRCAENFIQVDCKIVKGNHEGFDYYPFFRLVEATFANSNHVSFHISKKEFMHFRVKNSMFLVHHGASAEYKYKIPNDFKGRVALVQRIMKIAEREGDYEGVHRRFFIKGDTHSFEGLDMGQFTFYTFGALPSGDEYADALALQSTPTQNALILGDGKDYSTLHVCF